MEKPKEKPLHRAATVVGTPLPIVAYGSAVLKKRAKEIQKGHPGLVQLIADMYATLHDAQGVGLAAPQVNEGIRLFVTDGKGYEKEEPGLKDFRKVFINPAIVEESGQAWPFNEGCLSIPGIREDVNRKPRLRIRYVDENWMPHEETYEGIAARIIQHEYDHIEGVLFTDRLSAFRKRLLKGKLDDIAKGKVDVEYRMRFAGK
jgi:peptide deformylase